VAAPSAAVVAFSALHPQDPRLAQIQEGADAYVRKDEPSSLTHAVWRAVVARGGVGVDRLTTGSC
jgi:hypothetical protein